MARHANPRRKLTAPAEAFALMDRLGGTPWSQWVIGAVARRIVSELADADVHVSIERVEAALRGERPKALAELNEIAKELTE